MKSLFITAVFITTYLSSWGQVYKYFAGNLHAHTGYSDGNKDGLSMTPEVSFKYAKDSKNFHFLGISEHNHKEAYMDLPDYAKGIKEADKINSNTFACLYGMEYGLYDPGHVLIYGVDELIGWEDGNHDIKTIKNNYNSLWNVLANYPDAVVTLAHPSSSQFSNLLGIPYSIKIDKIVCGVAVMNGPHTAENTDYVTKSPKSYAGYYRSLLALGYHVGPTIDHDNHRRTFGRMASSRTMVLATKLGREEIMAAYRAMRFYATTDWNIQVEFIINNLPMGSQLFSHNAASIRVVVKDPDASDKVASIKLMHGQPGSKKKSTMLVSSNTDKLDHVHDFPKGEDYYYYLEIEQADGDKVYTSPIWVHRLK